MRSSVSGARADPVAEFYAKRLVTIVAGTATGGTYDLYARTIARHIGKYIPGSPKVVVQNMPGAGGYLGAMRVLEVGPHDGTIVGALGSSALPFQPLLDPNSPKFDALHINWLGAVAGYNVLMLVRSDVPVYSVDDLRKRETVMATIAAGQFNSVVVAAANAALGTRIKGVRGHKGMNPAMLALESGEVEGYPTAPVDALKRLYSKQTRGGDIPSAAAIWAGAIQGLSGRSVRARPRQDCSRPKPAGSRARAVGRGLRLYAGSRRSAGSVDGTARGLRSHTSGQGFSR